MHRISDDTRSGKAHAVDAAIIALLVTHGKATLVITCSGRHNILSEELSGGVVAAQAEIRYVLFRRVSDARHTSVSRHTSKRPLVLGYCTVNPACGEAVEGVVCPHTAEIPPVMLW